MYYSEVCKHPPGHGFICTASENHESKRIPRLYNGFVWGSATLSRTRSGKNFSVCLVWVDLKPIAPLPVTYNLQALRRRHQQHYSGSPGWRYKVGYHQNVDQFWSTSGSIGQLLTSEIWTSNKEPKMSEEEDWKLKLIDPPGLLNVLFYSRMKITTYFILH